MSEEMKNMMDEIETVDTTDLYSGCIDAGSGSCKKIVVIGGSIVAAGIAGLTIKNWKKIKDWKKERSTEKSIKNLEKDGYIVTVDESEFYDDQEDSEK